MEKEIYLANKLGKRVFIVLYDNLPNLNAFQGSDLDYITRWTYVPFDFDAIWEQLRTWLKEAIGRGDEKGRIPSPDDLLIPYRAYLATLEEDVTSIQKALQEFIIPVVEGARPSTLFARQFENIEDSKPHDTLMSAFQGDKRLFLLGEGGLGKTTALIQFARDALAAFRENPVNAYLPLFMFAADWWEKGRGALSISAYLQQMLPNFGEFTEDDVNKFIRDRVVVLIIDGLDELPSQEESEKPSQEENKEPTPLEKFIEMLNALPPNLPMVVSSREDNAELNGVRRIRLRFLRDEEIQDYLNRSGHPHLWEMIAGDPDFKALAGYPLFLNLMVVSKDDEDQSLWSSDGDLKEKQLRLFEAFVLRRLKQEWKLRERLPFETDVIYRALQRLAGNDLLGRGANVLHWDDFSAVIPDSTDEFINFCMNLRFIRRRDDKSWAFAHLLLRDALALPVLLEKLKDNSPQVRRSAADALGRLRDARAVQPLIAALQDEDWGVRSSAAKALGEIGDKRAVLPLIDTISDKNNAVRFSVAYALGELGDIQAIDSLRKTLVDQDETVRYFAIEALGKLGDQSIIDDLTYILQDENESSHIRRVAAIALAQFGEVTVNTLIEALNNKKWQIRDSVAFALGQSGEAALNPLISVLQDKKNNSRMRSGAADALRHLRDPRAIKPLLAVLQDKTEDNEVRKFAADALWWFGTPEALEAVRKWEEEQNSQ